MRRQTNEAAVKAMHDKQDMVVALKAKMLMCDVAYEQQAQKKMADKKNFVEGRASKWTRRGNPGL